MKNVTDTSTLAIELRWHQLTPSQREEFRRRSNGCGAGIFVAPKKGVHFESCVIHDYDYERGGNARDRLIADLLFLQDMLQRLADLGEPLWTTRIAMWQAFLYFLLVRAFGWYYFNNEPTARVRDVLENH